MARWLERYQQGFYQEVYDELVALQESVFDESIYQEAKLVAQMMMKQVRQNLEMLIPRLKVLGYQFVDGYWDRELARQYAPEELVRENEKYRILNIASSNTLSQLSVAEKFLGTFPLSVRSWYEEVGSVNFVGTFPASETRPALSDILDPLLIFPVEDLSDQFSGFSSEELDEMKDEEGRLTVDISVDSALKYGYSGSGGYCIKIPCKAFDTRFELENETLMFVDYLRICFQWGGFFGLASAKEKALPSLTSEELTFLTQGLLQF
jgi:hypothetical protein